MELRAVPAQGFLAPLAVLVPIATMLVAAAWAVTVFPPLALLVIAGGLAATAAAGRHTYGTRMSLVAAAGALLAAVVALPLWYAVSINTSICGKDVNGAWTSFVCMVGALVFFAVGSFGLRTHRASIVPLALLAAVLAMLLMFAVVPGAQGACET